MYQNTYLPQFQYPQRQEQRPMMPYMQQNMGFACVPVTSREAAEVYQIPFDGSTTYFVDTANGKIYAKTFNATNGTAPLVTFSRDAETVVATPEYATVGDVQEIKQTINRLAKELAAVKKGGVVDAD